MLTSTMTLVRSTKSALKTTQLSLHCLGCKQIKFIKWLNGIMHTSRMMFARPTHSARKTSNLSINHNYNKVLECDWLSPAMIWTVRVRARARMDQSHLKFFLRIGKLLSIPSPVRFLPFLLLILL